MSVGGERVGIDGDDLLRWEDHLQPIKILGVIGMGRREHQSSLAMFLDYIFYTCSTFCEGGAQGVICYDRGSSHGVKGF